MRHTSNKFSGLLSIMLLVLGCTQGTLTKSDSAGHVELAVILDDGSAILTVHWTITHPSGYSREGDIEVTDPAATVSAYVSGIPAGTGYTMRLTATTTADAACDGRATFAVMAGRATLVSMTLQCLAPEDDGDFLLNAGINLCPTIDYLTASPLIQGLDGKITVNAEASDMDEADVIYYTWTAVPSGNAFDDANAAATSFNCSTDGIYTLTLTVRDGPVSAGSTCTASGSMVVECQLSRVFDEVGWGSILLGRPTDTSITINVVSDIHHVTPDRLYEVYFEHGTAPDQLYHHTSPVVPGGNDPIVVLISGLSPNTKYHYRMQYRPLGGNDGDWLATEVEAFHTQRLAGETFVFTLQADSHLGHTQVRCDESRYRDTIESIQYDEPDFHFDLGDTFINPPWTWKDGGVKPGEMETVYPQYLAQRQYLGAVGRSSPVFLVLGNHENEEGWNLDDTDFVGDSIPIMNQNARKRYYLNPVPDDFYSGFDEPWDVIDGDHLRDACYAFHWGNALFVVIDPFLYTSVVPFTPSFGELQDEDIIGDRWSWTLGASQYQWLKQTLSESTATFKFVLTHHITGGGTGTVTGYGRGGAEMAHLFEWGGRNADNTWGFSDRRSLADGWASPIHQLMVEHGVTILFHGHDHLYAKEDLDNIVYQECPRPCDPNPADSFALATDYNAAIASGNALPNNGHLRVTVSPDQVTVDYVRSPDRTIIKSYTINALPANSPPMVADLSVTTFESTPVDVVLTGNDPNGDVLSFEVLRAPAHGALYGSGAQLTYVPEAGYLGNDLFIYQAHDAATAGNIAYLDIAVLP